MQKKRSVRLWIAGEGRPLQFGEAAPTIGKDGLSYKLPNPTDFVGVDLAVFQNSFVKCPHEPDLREDRF